MLPLPLFQVLTGYATFVSDPHFLTNDILDQQAAEQVNVIVVGTKRPNRTTRFQLIS